MEDNKVRSNRKLDHIKYALHNNTNIKTGLEDIVLIHQALPKYDLQDIDVSTSFLGKKISAPIYINAMTGGHKAIEEINKYLGTVAAKLNIPIAVGSQKAGIVDSGLSSTYSIVRDVNPNGIVIGNLSANSSLEDAKKAVDMINADALQLHLNVAQEIVMKEGDTEFKGIKENIIYLKKNLDVPIIVKEVGCGMSKETIQELQSMNVEYIDISGAGGTNFVDIELSRHEKVLDNSLVYWGIPTAYSIIEANIVDCKNYLVSGGIKTSLDVAKCIAMGAKMVGLSGEILRQYYNKIDLYEWISELIINLKKIMLLTNSNNINGLTNCPKVIRGELLEWKNARN